MAGFNAGQAHLQNLLNASNQNGGTFRDDMLLAQDPAGFQQVDPASSNSKNFLNKVVGKLKEIWNRPIIAPTITKEEHDQLIQGGGGGVHNWQNH
jgi:hypothetical protein